MLNKKRRVRHGLRVKISCTKNLLIHETMSNGNV